MNKKVANDAKIKRGTAQRKADPKNRDLRVDPG